MVSSEFDAKIMDFASNLSRWCDLAFLMRNSDALWIMIYGYARVSTEAQELRSQLAQLKEAGCEKIFQEKESRMREDRPQLEKLLKLLTAEDVLIVVATDRLGGGPRLLLNILDAIRTSGAGFKSLAEPHIDTTASPELAEMVFFWVGWAARWEWQRIRARTSGLSQTS